MAGLPASLNHTAQLLDPIKKPMTVVVLPSGAQPLTLAMLNLEETGRQFSLIPRPDSKGLGMRMVNLMRICKSIMAGNCNIISKPFPPPVSDHLQYANTEEEGWSLW